MEDSLILVTAPNEAGRNFIKLLMYKKLAFAVLTNSAHEEKKLKKMGVARIIRINTAHAENWFLPHECVGKVFIFENSLNLTCRFLQICRSWTRERVCVITQSGNPQGIYKGMGADQVVYRLKGELGFLLNPESVPESRTI
ncbi:hypothetical protein Q5741_12800 [Paenibacillus sp. JX-17]|uniref:Uncharacterized protein n=1 Tax=Paenibacillus lacisoli TaxID=3064525 RepID=A0ABT9CEJ2_9BACL|nr:hypothetical protein [Paenibacillus sp. JX-17]MDO7907285.1 hypothetical protein [Paenibacillus sp. JX-17]